MAAVFSIRLKGLPELLAKYVALAVADPWTKAAARVLYRRGTRVLEVAQRLAPVDTGALRSSGFVELPDVRGGGVKVVIGFGGAAAPYALIVHEDLSSRHTTGQAKFLEVPFLAEKQGTLDELRAAVIATVRGDGFKAGQAAAFSIGGAFRSFGEAGA
jgi:hypothetical protein